MKQFYEFYKRCMVHIIVRTSDGRLLNSVGFHIGDGYIVTVRHFIENHKVVSVSEERSLQKVSIKRALYPSNPAIDLAVLETDFSLKHYLEKETIFDGEGKPLEKTGFIPLGGHLDDWLGDEFVLSNVAVFGYPSIPLSRDPVLVAVQGQVNAVIDKHNGVPHPHFIISVIPREGFIGGPVISEYGFLLGVYVESLITENQAMENGFASVLSIEPLLVLLHNNGIHIKGNESILEDTFNPESPMVV